jgi:hypothetical protein
LKSLETGLRDYEVLSQIGHSAKESILLQIFACVSNLVEMIEVTFMSDWLLKLGLRECLEKSIVCITEIPLLGLPVSRQVS